MVQFTYNSATVNIADGPNVLALVAAQFQLDVNQIIMINDGQNAVQLDNNNRRPALAGPYTISGTPNAAALAATQTPLAGSEAMIAEIRQLRQTIQDRYGRRQHSSSSATYERGSSSETSGPQDHASESSPLLGHSCLTCSMGHPQVLQLSDNSPRCRGLHLSTDDSGRCTPTSCSHKYHSTAMKNKKTD